MSVDWQELLEELYYWAAPNRCDAYIILTHVADGDIELCCAKNVRPPEHWDTHSCWVAEFVCGNVDPHEGLGMSFGDHIWAYGAGLGEAITRLHEHVLLERKCGCQMASQLGEEDDGQEMPEEGVE